MKPWLGMLLYEYVDSLTRTMPLSKNDEVRCFNNNSNVSLTLLIGYNHHAIILVASIDTADDRSRDSNIQNEINIPLYFLCFLLRIIWYWLYAFNDVYDYLKLILWDQNASLIHNTGR